MKSRHSRWIRLEVMVERMRFLASFAFVATRRPVVALCSAGGTVRADITADCTTMCGTHTAGCASLLSERDPH